MNMHGFPLEKINVKLANTYWGRTKIYFLKWGCRAKKFEKPCFRGCQASFTKKKKKLFTVTSE